jgi:hypothetical protein
MAYNTDKLFASSKAAIVSFAERHREETFYGFAIDASMLCLNSIEQFQITLTEYRNRWLRRTRELGSIAEMTAEDHEWDDFLLEICEINEGLDRSDDAACLKLLNESRARQREEGCPYDSKDHVLDLRKNTGDWAYQGFAELVRKDGFDERLYQKHYRIAMDSADGRAPHSKYARAMTELVERLVSEKTFSVLRCSEDFIATWADHDY